MVHSTETTTLEFLDGGVSDTRGNFGADCGMRWFGQLAIAYILYELHLSPQALLGSPNIPTQAELRQLLASDAASVASGVHVRRGAA
jgi:hypothetical protein